MARSYQHQLHANHRRRRHIRRWGFIALIIIVGLAVWLHSLKSQTQVTAAQPVTKTIVAANTTKLWSEPFFSLKLPSGWVQVGTPTASHYEWRGGQKGVDDSRTIDVYVNDIPANLAVNRVIAVDSNGAEIDVQGAVSANCSTFTGSGVHTPGEGPAPGLWNNLPFICDLANYERDVVGTISDQGVNTIKLTGASGQQHRFFLVYTDSSYAADYDIFTAALQSFQAK